MSDSDNDDQYAGRFKIYTKTGDQGTTTLYNMQRLPKNVDYFQALGDVDELNSHLGLVREYFLQMLINTKKTDDDSIINVDKQLTVVQSRLFDVGAAIATPLKHSPERKLTFVAFNAEENIKMLEDWIDEYDTKLPPLTCFVLPSGGLTASTLHVCRTIARRAERSVVGLVGDGDCDPNVMKYLNRLSDYLFIAARYCSQTEGKAEVLWEKEMTEKNKYKYKTPAKKTEEEQQQPEQEKKD